MLFVLDNYDSFTYNLVQYLGELGAEPVVERNDALTVDSALARRPKAIVISPGPGLPKDAGISVPLVRAAAERRIPLLGVCLGHQAIGEAFGAKVVRARRLMHGKTSEVRHEGQGILRGVPSPLTAMRYHSLVVDPDSLPPSLTPTAWSDDEGWGRELMAVQHTDAPIHGVQFHPESIGTSLGKDILRNFLAACALALTFAAPLRAQCPDGTPPPCRTARRAAPARPDSSTALVVPLTAVGGDAALRALGANFTAIVAVNVTAGDVHGTEAPALAALPADARARAAARQGAGALIDGTLLALGPTVRATVRLTAARSGRVLTTTTVEGPRDSLLTMADRASLALLREWWRAQPGPHLRSGIVTRSLSALRHYINAMGIWAHGGAWRVLLDSAIRYDPGFLAAWTWLAVPASERSFADALGGFQAMGEAFELSRGVITPDSASRTLRVVAARQPPADRQETGSLPFVESVASLAAASINPPTWDFQRLALCEGPLRRTAVEAAYADALRAWLGTLAGCSDSLALVLAKSVVALDSSFVPARRLLTSELIDAGDTVAARRLLDAGVGEDTAWARFQRLLLSARLAPPAMDTTGIALVLTRWHRFRDLADALPSFRQWIRRQGPQGPMGADLALGMILEVPLNYAMGRRDTASAILRATNRAMAREVAGSSAQPVGAQAWLMFASFPSPAADSLLYPNALDTLQVSRMLRMIGGASAGQSSTAGFARARIRMIASGLARTTWLNGIFALERGDATSARRFSAWLDSLSADDSVLTRGLALGLSGEIALASGSVDTAISRFSQAVGVSATTTPARYRWLLTKHYAATGQSELALRLARTITMPSMLHGSDNIGYYPLVLKIEGEVLETLGRRQEAAARYREYIDLRQDADPPLQTEVADARARLARVTSP